MESASLLSFKSEVTVKSLMILYFMVALVTAAEKEKQLG